MIASALNGLTARSRLSRSSAFATIGSVANVIVAERGRNVGGLHFVEYARVGVPLALITTTLGTIWLLIVHR